MSPSIEQRTCTNCAHRNRQPEGKEPHCLNLIPIEDGDVLRCNDHQTTAEDAADIAAHAAIRKAKGAAK